MARPNPVPPKRRVVLASACENDWKSRSPAVASTPIPVSSTAKRILGPAASTFTTTAPRGVNFTAFATRFDNAWRSRTGSPRTYSGRPGATSS